MIYSDFGVTLDKFVEDNNMVVYRLAMDKLKDTERPRFIRAYFDL